VKLLHWDAGPEYLIAFSTRLGGVSPAPFSSLNLNRKTGDTWENVAENRRRLCTAVGAEFAKLTLNHQRHSAVVNRAHPGRQDEPGDGLWTDEPSVPMLKLVADCLPIALARQDRPALALLHAGRIGLIDGVVQAGVAALGGRVKAAIGPGIGPCCYEVGEEVAAPFRAEYGPDVLQGRNLDIWTAAERALRRAGVKRVERYDVCTSCNADLFYSYRRDGPRRGAQGVIGFVRP
jgi:YfiH family protein